jgi:HlyD family secretion protein
VRLRTLGKALFSCLLAACSQSPAPLYQGYAEGDFVRVAAPFGGTLQTLAVKRGQPIDAGAPLFSLESKNEAAAKDEAAQRLKAAEAQHANLTTGKRAPEIEVISAQIAQANAAERLSHAQLERDTKLFRAAFISKEKLDETRATHDRDSAKITELSAQLQSARLASREQEIRAAEAEVESARAVLAQRAWALAQKTVASPVAALVYDTLYAEGEWVPAGNPVVSLLPPANIKVRFFVPETIVGGLRLGQKISIGCDGCGAALTAQISYISRQPEYTPPIIYSKDTRAKLVFLLEARAAPEDSVKLHPGQPLDVKLLQ